jgi:hypothetical protein
VTCMRRFSGRAVRVVDVVILRRPSRVTGVRGAGAAGDHAGFGAESWTLLADDGARLEPAERFLAYLSSVERSPNTVRAYAHDLKDWFSFLQLRGVQWKR